MGHGLFQTEPIFPNLLCHVRRTAAARCAAARWCRYIIGGVASCNAVVNLDVAVDRVLEGEHKGVLPQGLHTVLGHDSRPVAHCALLLNGLNPSENTL
jgi:hypothetical protein